MSHFSKIFIGALFLTIVSCQGRKEHLKNQFLLRGNVQLEKQEYKEAIRLYSEAIKIDPEYVDAYNNRGSAHLQKGDAVSALEDFNKAIELRPNYTDAHYNRANAYSALGRTNSSLKDMEVVKQAFPDSAYVYFTMGVIQFDGGNFAAAVEAFNQALNLDADNHETYLNRATAFYRLNDLQRARADLDQVLEMGVDLGHTYNVISLIEMKKGNLNGAMLSNMKALNAEPNNPYFLNNRGYFKLESEDLEGAVSDINESIRLDPENGWAYRNKGIYYYMTGANEDAWRVLNQAEKYNKHIELLHFYKGLVLLALDQKSGACEAFQESKNRNEMEGELAYEQNCQSS